jgi:hypothetical protein
MRRLSPSNDWFAALVNGALLTAFAPPAAPRSTNPYAAAPDRVRTYADAVKGNK